MTERINGEDGLKITEDLYNKKIFVPEIRKYAPVVKNGYMYLVNAKMKTASKKVKVSSDADVSSVGEELFVLTAGKKVELITFK